MRLLQSNNDGDFSLTEFNESDIPEYTILSHTWEQDNSKEVTYAEVINETGQDKEGFKKIRFCGEQARQDGLPYFWVDTCCINKQEGGRSGEGVQGHGQCKRGFRDTRLFEQYTDDRCSNSHEIRLEARHGIKVRNIVNNYGEVSRIEGYESYAGVD